jgi:putative RecB family exonuclease
MPTVEVSHSRVQAYQRCPWLYHLVYDKGWRSGPNGSMALGQSLHHTLDAYLASSNTEHTLERLLELYDQLWVNEGFKSPQETMDVYERGRLMLKHFFDIDNRRAAAVEATEKEFIIPLGNDIAFRGTLDRLDRYPDGQLEIIEYKTHADRWNQERCDADQQMTFYALGMTRLEGTTPKLKYYFLSTGESFETRRTPEQMDHAATLIQTVAGNIRAGIYAPNHGHCPRCEFSKRCEKSNIK